VVGVAVRGDHPVELILGSTFQIAQKVGIGQDAAFGEGRVYALAIGEQQSVANVEEDDFDCGVHEGKSSRDLASPVCGGETDAASRVSTGDLIRRRTSSGFKHEPVGGFSFHGLSGIE
jgi:hypothetical protein